MSLINSFRPLHGSSCTLQPKIWGLSALLIDTEALRNQQPFSSCTGCTFWSTATPTNPAPIPYPDKLLKCFWNLPGRLEGLDILCVLIEEVFDKTVGSSLLRWSVLCPPPYPHNNSKPFGFIVLTKVNYPTILYISLYNHFLFMQHWMS